MSKTMRRIPAVLLALAVLAASLFCTGCSTPKTAITVDGENFTTGEYLAYLYNAFYQVYYNQGMYYYDSQAAAGTTGMNYDVWNEEYTYEENTYDLRGYVKAIAKDSIIRGVALDRLMKDHQIALTEENEKSLKEYLDSMPQDAFIDYGFNNDSFAKMYRSYTYYENTLFNTLYGENGERAVPAEEMRTFFDNNYLSYEIINYSLADSEGKALSDEEKANIDTKLAGYLAMYNEGGDFNKVIDQYNADVKAESATEEDAAAAEATEPTASTLADNRKDIVISEDTSTPKGLIEKIKELEFNKAAIVEYTTDANDGVAGVASKALVLRLDPEADRTDEEGNAIDTYYADQHDAILYYMRYDEFDKEVKDKMATLAVTVNDKAIKACDPYNFRSMFVQS